VGALAVALLAAHPAVAAVLLELHLAYTNKCAERERERGGRCTRSISKFKIDACKIQSRKSMAARHFIFCT
jgi:hypothetical protein